MTSLELRRCGQTAERNQHRSNAKHILPSLDTSASWKDEENPLSFRFPVSSRFSEVSKKGSSFALPFLSSWQLHLHCAFSHTLEFSAKTTLWRNNTVPSRYPSVSSAAFFNLHLKIFPWVSQICPNTDIYPYGGIIVDFSQPKISQQRKDKTHTRLLFGTHYGFNKESYSRR